jgi:hypothetical protein
MDSVEPTEDSWKVVDLADRETPALLHAIISWLLS